MKTRRRKMDLSKFTRPSTNIEDERQNNSRWREPLYEAASMMVPPELVQKALNLSDWLGITERLGLPPMPQRQPAPAGSLADQAGANDVRALPSLTLDGPRVPLPPILGGGSPPIRNQTVLDGNAPNGSANPAGPPTPRRVAGSIADMLDRLGTLQMRIGSTFKKDRQRYECVGFHNHVNRLGHESTLLVFQSRCAECGAPFRFMTTEGRAKRRDVSRRCEIHKRPGVPVRLQQRTASIKPVESSAIGMLG